MNTSNDKNDSLSSMKNQSIPIDAPESETNNWAAVPQPDTAVQTQNYPMPDPDLSLDDFKDFGYMYDDMLPISQDRALALLGQDMTIYLIYSDDTEAMVFDSNEIYEHTEMFGIERNDWEQSSEYIEAVSRPRDHFKIYQMKQGEEYHDLRFQSFDYLHSHGLEAERQNYDLVYTGPLSVRNTLADTLESIFVRFNLDRPADFTGHSLSVSDIITISHNGTETAHYVDSIGFKELPQFLQPMPEHNIDTQEDNPLKAAEISTEQNYTMIDGIRNNTDDKADQKRSVSEQVKESQKKCREQPQQKQSRKSDPGMEI